MVKLMTEIGGLGRICLVPVITPSNDISYKHYGCFVVYN